MAQPHSRTRSQREVLDALADVVSVDPTSQNQRTQTYDSTGSASYSGQAPMSAMETLPAVPTKDPIDPMGPSSGRSKKQGNAPPPPPPSKSGFGRFANAFRRHNTDEKDAKRREKEKRMQRTIDESLSSRMDVIDRMDLSGLGASLFHHDSPYDACSPHSNRNQRRAPVNAFDNTIDPMTGLPIGQARPSGSRPGLSPLAQATMRKMSDNAGDVPDDGKGGRLLSPGNRSRSALASQLPALGRNQTSSTYNSNGQTPTSEAESYDAASVGSAADRDVEAERNYRNRGYYNAPNNVSRGRADVANPNADIWGVTSEPWQDFAQPAGSRREGTSRRSSNDGLQSSASSVFDMEAVLTGKKPVRTGSALADGAISPGGQSSGGSASGSGNNKDGPKRSKSLVKRIKYARQYGNVPPPDDDVVERAEAFAANNASNGASNGNRRAYTHHHSPSSPPLQSQSPSLSQGATMINRSGTLRANGDNGEAYTSGHNMNESQNGNSNLGRKNSVFGRFRGKSRDQRDVAVAR